MFNKNHRKWSIKREKTECTCTCTHRFTSTEGAPMKTSNYNWCSNHHQQQKHDKLFTQEDLIKIQSKQSELTTNGNNPMQISKTADDPTVSSPL